MNTTISILTEIPEDLYQAVSHYLDDHRDWDQDRVFAAAVSLFLAQNHQDSDTCGNSGAARPSAQTYFDSLFKRPV